MAVGFILFAAVMLMVIGIFHIFWGLAAIIEDEFFVVSGDYLYKVDATTWGWIHLIGGIVVVLAGMALFRGSPWAQAVAVFIAALSAIANFMTIEYYPFWSVLIIALDVLVIWAIAVHGKGFHQMMRAPNVE
jgi:hypothetical protein